MTEHIEIEGVHLLGCAGINARREDFFEFLKHVNGCGAGNAKFDFIPDTMYGLSVTPVCNLHDDAYTFCEPTQAGFAQSNNEFYENLKQWIKAKSNIFMRYPRLARAKTYYEAVNKFGWDAFVDCKKAQGIKL